MLVLDRRGVRHLRRAGDLLTDAAHEQRRQRLIGIGLMCGAVAAFACLDAMAKYLGTHMPVSQVVGVRYASAFLIALMFSNPINRPGLLRTGRPVLQLGRSVLLLGSTVFNFMAFRYLQLDEALAILFSTPFLVAILAGPDSRRMGRLAALDRDHGRLRRRAGGGAPRHGRLAMGGAALARQRVLLRRLQHHHADAVDAPIPARPRCSTPTCSASWSWCRCCRSSGPPPPSWIDWVLMVAVGVFGAGGHFLLILAHRQRAGLGAVAVHLHPDRLGDDASATWCSPTCPATGPWPGPGSSSPPAFICSTASAR